MLYSYGFIDRYVENRINRFLKVRTNFPDKFASNSQFSTDSFNGAYDSRYAVSQVVKIFIK